MMLILEFLGSPRLVWSNGTPVSITSRKELALLAYLAVHNDRAINREELVALLWPEASEQDARNSLRVALSNLRQRLGTHDPSLLTGTRYFIQFGLNVNFRLDVIEFLDRIEQYRSHAHVQDGGCDECISRLEQAAHLYRGEFLAGTMGSYSEAFNHWMQVKRQIFHKQALFVLHTLATKFAQRQNYEQMCTYASRQLELEAWYEPAWRQLIEGLVLSGDCNAALVQYRACCRVLAQELGVEPDAKTRKLYEWLLVSRATGADSA